MPANKKTPPSQCRKFNEQSPDSERGSGTIEYVAVGVLIAVLVGGVMAFPYAKHLIPGTQASVCIVTTGSDSHKSDGSCNKDNATFMSQPVAPQPVDNDEDSQMSDDEVETRSEIIERAGFWLKQPVPYSMENYTQGPDGKLYRTDCSGFVSMAWGLNDSYSTVTLPQVARPIAKEDLKPGDILLKGGPGSGGANGHVGIFNGWANESHTSYYIIEQAGGVGTQSRVISYPYSGDNSYVPYRKKGL